MWMRFHGISDADIVVIVGVLRRSHSKAIYFIFIQN